MTMTEYYTKAIMDLLKGIHDEKALNLLYDMVLSAWMHERENTYGL